MEIDFLLLILGAHRFVKGAHGFAFAENIQRDSLADVALGAAVGEETDFAAHHVDKAGGDHLAADIYVGATMSVPEFTHSRDGVSGNGNATGGAWRASAIANAAVSQDNVVLWSASAGDDGNARGDGEDGEVFQRLA